MKGVEQYNVLSSGFLDFAVLTFDSVDEIHKWISP